MTRKELQNEELDSYASKGSGYRPDWGSIPGRGMDFSSSPPRPSTPLATRYKRLITRK